jgi:hypothetical protein
MNLVGLGQVAVVGFICVRSGEVVKKVWACLSSDDSCKTTRVQTRLFLGFPGISEKPKLVSGTVSGTTFAVSGTTFGTFEHKVSRLKTVILKS